MNVKTSTRTARYLDVSRLRDHPGNVVKLYATKTLAAAALTDRRHRPEVRPERADNRWFRGWVLAVEPVGDPGEGRVLLTQSGGWLVLCAIGCQDDTAARACTGHPMSADESRAFTLALLGHRTEIICIATTRTITGIDWSTLRPFTDHVPAGSLHRVRCLCGWQSPRMDERRWASRAARAHQANPDHDSQR